MRLHSVSTRKAFTVGYRTNGHREPVLHQLSDAGRAALIGMEARTTYRRETDTYTNREERVPGFMMVNGVLTKREEK